MATGPLGLGGKVLLFAVSIAALPLLVSSLWMISATRDELKSAVNDSLLATAEDAMEQVRSVVEPALSILSLLRDALDSEALGIEAKVALLHGGIEALPGLEALRLEVGARPPVYLFKQPFKARLDEAGLLPSEALSTFDDLPAGKAPAVGEPLYLSSLETWLLPLSVAMVGEAPDDSARLFAYLDLSRLQDALAALPFREAGSIWLMYGQRKLLFQGASNPLDPRLAEFACETIATIRHGVVVTPYETDEAARQLIAVGMMEIPPWTILVALPRRRAYAIVAGMQRHLALWIALGLGAAVVGSWALAYRTGRPIREMAVIAEQVGRGNFRVRVQETGRRDEVGALGRRLNDMILDLAESRRHLEELARKDTLTELPNRFAVLEHLRRKLAEEMRDDGCIALLFLDLDRFKKVNDSFGHALGDQLLKLAAERLRRCLTEADMAARLGGDEFLVVLGQAPDRGAAAVVASRVIEAFGAPFDLMNFEIYVGATIGISMAPEDASEISELMKYADMALFEAKNRGRGQFRFFGTELKVNAMRQLTLDARLRKALERDELTVFYQPIVDTYSGRVCSMEALVRWPDREGGFVASPDEFVQLAEETGLIVPLGEWIMDTALRQTRAWHRAGLPPVAVAVNISAQQFARHDFRARVYRTIDSTGLKPEFIKLEVTERLLLEDMSYAIALIESLRETGIQFSIDDFGTGYSSLAYLRRFPLDNLKVAQEFVRGMSESPSDARIAETIIMLAKSLGLKVIAEGVETFEELDFLRRRNCELIQGYLFSRPLSSRKFEDLLIAGGHFAIPHSGTQD